MPEDVVVRGDVRVFFLEGDGDPECKVTYEGFAIVTRPAAAFGDITNIYAPDPTQRRRYRVIAKTSGAETPPEMPIQDIYKYALSKWLRLGKMKCDHGLQAHMGQCSIPTDYEGGYTKILALEKARIRSWGLDGNLGSLNPNDEGTVNEDVPFAGEAMYEIKKFDAFARLGAATITRPLTDGVIADSVSCGGECGFGSDGCSIIAVVSSNSGAAIPTLYFTDDGGSTVGSTAVDTLLATENTSGVGFDGSNIFVLSSASDGIHYAPLADILDATETWSKVGTASGFVATKGPVASYVAGPRDIFLAGLGGYVYKANNIASGVEVLEAGNATVEDLNDIAGIDDMHVVAVGNDNSVIISVDGETFSAITGPIATVNLNRVWMVNRNKFFIAGANGKLYYTKNGGNSWKTSGFAGDTAGAVNDIVMVTAQVGFMAHTTAGNVGRIFKTINGGATWVILPESAGGPAVPAHRVIRRLLPCDQNTFYAVGTDAAGTSGMLFKGL